MPTEAERHTEINRIENKGLNTATYEQFSHQKADSVQINGVECVPYEQSSRQLDVQVFVDAENL